MSKTNAAIRALDDEIFAVMMRHRFAGVKDQGMDRVSWYAECSCGAYILWRCMTDTGIQTHFRHLAEQIAIRLRELG
jgi:predicted branched-subunit amino acid permease